MKRFNDWLAVKITNGVGTMYCAYAFAALSLVSLPSAIKSGNAVTLVSWVSQTFLQLVLLSVIIVGQNLMANQHSELHDKVDDLRADHADSARVLHARLDAITDAVAAQ